MHLHIEFSQSSVVKITKYRMWCSEVQLAHTYTQLSVWPAQSLAYMRITLGENRQDLPKSQVILTDADSVSCSLVWHPLFWFHNLYISSVALAAILSTYLLTSQLFHYAMGLSMLLVFASWTAIYSNSIHYNELEICSNSAPNFRSLINMWLFS